MASPSPLPQESPFDETSTEGSLRRIAESIRALKEAESHAEQTALDLAVAKDEHKKSLSLVSRRRHEAYNTAADETAELPLFPRLKSALPVEAGSPVASARIADPSTFLLLLVPGIPFTVTDKLASRGINTIGDLASFTNGGGKLTDVKGISQLIADKTADALESFWKSRGGEGKP